MHMFINVHKDNLGEIILQLVSQGLCFECNQGKYDKDMFFIQLTGGF